MQFPSSARTSWLGAVGAVALAVAATPGIPEYVRSAAGYLAAALVGGGFVAAADHRTVQQATKNVWCELCGRTLVALDAAAAEPPKGQAQPADSKAATP